MTTVLVNPYLQFGGGAGGGGSVAITYAGKTIPAEGTGAITISGDYLDSSSVAMSELTNDVVLAVFECNTADTIPTPTDYAHVTGSPFAGSSSELTVFWHRAASDTLPGISVADPGDHWIGFQAAFRGVKVSGNPWNVLGSGTATPDASDDLTIPSVTTSVNNCLVVVILAHGLDDTDDTNYTDWACSTLTNAVTAASGTLYEIEDEGTDLGGGGGIGMAAGHKATAGATGSITVHIDNPATFAYLVIALEPAAP